MAKGDLRFNNHENFVFAYYFEKNPFMKFHNFNWVYSNWTYEVHFNKERKNYGKTKFNKSEKLKMVTRLEIGGMVKTRETSSNIPFCTSHAKIEFWPLMPTWSFFCYV